MKTEFVDVNETRKSLVVEIDSEVVDQEIDKVTRDYGKAARIPGFRAHLEGCPACREEYGSLRALLLEDAGAN